MVVEVEEGFGGVHTLKEGQLKCFLIESLKRVFFWFCDCWLVSGKSAWGLLPCEVDLNHYLWKR